MQLSWEVFKRIQRIRVQTNRLVNTLLAGAYKSAFKGQGVEFEEVRPFQTGDDIRTIDWNVTARMNTPYVKKFREERQLTVMLLVDISSSLKFGTNDREKREVLAEIGAAFAFAAIKNQDKVGLILFSDIIEKYIPPNRGLRHVLRVVRELLSFQPRHKETKIKDALTFFSKVQRKSSICFLMSDFLSSEDISHDLKLISKHHDLISVHVIDPKEMKFPKISLAHIDDLETGRAIDLDSSTDSFQNDFLEKGKLKLQKVKEMIRKAGGEYLELYTDKPYVTAIRSFFQHRAQRQ